MKTVARDFAVCVAANSLLACGTVETLRITPAGVTKKVSIESNVGGQALKFNF
jgi:hypothetical protein